MLAAVAYRAADGSFLPTEPFEIKRPGDGHGETEMDAFVRWAAERCQREMQNKEKEEAS